MLETENLSTSHDSNMEEQGCGGEDVDGGELTGEDAPDVATAEAEAGEQTRHPYHNFDWDSSIVHNAGALFGRRVRALPGAGMTLFL